MQFHFFFLMILAFAGVFQTVQLLELECLDSKDCGVSNCCVLSMQPNSFPTCRPLGEENSVCRPLNEAVNTSVTYPNGEHFELTNIYFILCPCSEGYTCELGSCV